MANRKLSSPKFTADFLNTKENEVQRQSHFMIRIDGFNDAFSFHIRTGNLPTISHSVTETRMFNETVKQASARSFNDLSITIHDAIGKDIERKLHDWQQKVQNTQDGYMGYAEDYKRTARITEYGINGEPRSQWKYTGAWPSSIDYGSMDKENVDKKSINLTLSYDKAWLVNSNEMTDTYFDTSK